MQRYALKSHYGIDYLTNMMDYLIICRMFLHGVTKTRLWPPWRSMRLYHSLTLQRFVAWPHKIKNIRQPNIGKALLGYAVIQSLVHSVIIILNLSLTRRSTF